MKYELDDDDVEFIARAVDALVEAEMKKTGDEIARLAAKRPDCDSADKWLVDFENLVLQERGFVTRRDSVVETLRNPIK